MAALAQPAKPTLAATAPMKPLLCSLHQNKPLQEITKLPQKCFSCNRNQTINQV